MKPPLHVSIYCPKNIGEQSVFMALEHRVIGKQIGFASSIAQHRNTLHSLRTARVSQQSHSRCVNQCSAGERNQRHGQHSYPPANASVFFFFFPPSSMSCYSTGRNRKLLIFDYKWKPSRKKNHVCVRVCVCVGCRSTLVYILDDLIKYNLNAETRVHHRCFLKGFRRSKLHPQ